MAARHDAVLRRVQELSLHLAEDLAQAALAADDADEKARLASAFHKITRGLRQSVALEARLVREADRAAREGEAREEARRVACVDARKGRLRTAGLRFVWDEADAEDCDDGDGDGAGSEDIVLELEDWIDRACEDEGFLAEPFADQLDRLRADLGFTAPAADLPDPAPPEPDPPDPGAYRTTPNSA